MSGLRGTHIIADTKVTSERIVKVRQKVVLRCQ
jgi:hypothetical protein